MLSACVPKLCSLVNKTFGRCGPERPDENQISPLRGTLAGACDPCAGHVSDSEVRIAGKHSTPG